MLLVQKREQDVLDIHLLMIELGSEPIGGLKGFEGLLGKAFLIHGDLEWGFSHRSRKSGANVMPDGSRY
jgi:hypothetical protein